MEKINQKLSLSDEENYSEEEEGEEGESPGSEESASDDSEEDTTSGVLEETRSSLSRLPLKKNKSRISKVNEPGNDEEEPDDVEIKVPETSKKKKVPELNAKDAKNFETVEKIIAGGQLEKLKVEQCKVYLRKNGLRLMGKKDVLIDRIKEHLGIINGGGEQKYPESSFVCNCKGDACTGDVVMFEQNVYEMYNISSRSATGPPCGSRSVAGRIVKESYGSAKQQHTFTIETMRQLWADEEMRRKVLLEKHSRGSLAKSNRKTRIQQKKMKTLCAVCRQRVVRNKKNTTQETATRMSPDKMEKKLDAKLQNQLPAVSTRKPAQIGEHKPALPPKMVLTEVCMNTTTASSTIKQHQGRSINVENNQSNGYQVANTILGRASSKQWICKYYPQGRCYFGDKCKYLHEEPPIKQQLCRYYARGRCYHGENCKYLHERR
ncbi:hypothetical protein MKW98_024991 [Papaver atlanticum]|uniref:Uncharacterized protein n=1 Tax=Papaver atlanticum TaxID=357466 RepID=A0AAD4T203_9MAGN|nr:hypothetical protein MKW98_024991 [Papaver atlanticum]